VNYSRPSTKTKALPREPCRAPEVIKGALHDHLGVSERVLAKRVFSDREGGEGLVS
jgi:hypothetical protein